MSPLAGVVFRPGTMHLFIKYGTVFLGSMFKFIFGPLTGAASGLSLWETTLISVGGMMTSVLIFSLIGQGARKVWVTQLRKHNSPRPLFTRANRRIVTVWKHFGLGGIAFFTPLIFSPIVGTMLAVSFGETPRRIVPAMLLSAIFWGVALTWLVRVAGGSLFA